MKNLNRLTTMTALFLALLCITLASHANDSEIVAELRRCAENTESQTRIACYEALGSSVLNNKSTTATANSEQKIARSSTPNEEVVKEEKSDMPDSLGGGLFAEKAGVKTETNRGHVTSCKKASDRKWFYIFANGQVWKQVDSRKRRYKECDFWVTIVKDSFGFKMIRDGQDGKIRIDRRR